MYKESKRVVPTAGVLGGASLSVDAANPLGGIGNGTGILMAVTIMYSCEFSLPASFVN